MCKKKFISLMLVLFMTVIYTLSPINDNKAYAAAVKLRYIKGFKLFIKEGGKESDAKAWCDSQPENKDEDEDNDWKVVSGNVNEGASGALKSEVAVFLCYTTTGNEDEAVTDIAVMNEQGNYSEGEYSKILENQKEVYIDMVNNMQIMLSEYRENYNSDVKTAVLAHDYMNGFVEDDSNKPLGDYLLDCSDEDLVNVLMQANGKIVIMIEEQLSSACDNGSNTWLDRMTKLGSYNNLRKKYISAYNNNTAKADKALKIKYNEKAMTLSENWGDIKVCLDLCEKYADDNKLNDMDDEQIGKFQEAHKGDEEAEAYFHANSLLITLKHFEYEDGTLLDFFAQDKNEVSGDNVKKLYPLVASLSEGQTAGVSEMVSIISLIENAVSASVLNDYDKGFSKELQDLGEDVNEVFDGQIEVVNKELEEWTKGDLISIYEGVDREVFKGGVAVTSTAQDYSSGAKTKWADSFVEEGGLLKTNIALGVSTVISAAISGLGAIAVSQFSRGVIEVGHKHAIWAYALSGHQTNTIYKNFPLTIPEEKVIRTFSDAEMGTAFLDSVDDIIANTKGTDQLVAENAKNVLKTYKEKGLSLGSNATKYKIFQGIKWGFAILTVILCVVDIVITSIALYNYYNVDHLPIPHHMVDLSYNENKETSYITYKSVLDQNGEYGDLNGGGGKQWLALYQTYDSDAGRPLIAPNENYDIVVQKKEGVYSDSSYSPLHMFGTPNTAQNLTFADGENGWSYNDKEGGIYLFFKRSEDIIVYEATNAGTVMSNGRVAVYTGLGVLAGIICGSCASTIIRKKKKEA